MSTVDYSTDKDYIRMTINDLQDYLRIADTLKYGKDGFDKESADWLETLPRDNLYGWIEKFEKEGKKDYELAEAVKKEAVDQAEKHLKTKLRISQKGDYFYVTNEVVVQDLAGDEEVHFDAFTDPRWAVAYVYCEKNNLMSWLLSHQQDGKLEEAYDELPFVEGKSTWGLGDYAVLKYKEDRTLTFETESVSTSMQPGI